MPIQIHNKTHVTVAERLVEAQSDKDITLTRVLTEVLQHTPVVVVKATVELENSTTKKIFTGISSANPEKSIEKSNPYEVAETSAVGRALGFAGYGLIDSVASADEMVKALNEKKSDDEPFTRVPVEESPHVCSQHDEPIAMKEGISKSTGKRYWYHRDENGMCFGQGYK